MRTKRDRDTPGRRWQRWALLAATVAVLVTLGTAGIRGAALRDFAAFLGIHRNVTPGAVESYAQRTAIPTSIGLVTAT